MLKANRDETSLIIFCIIFFIFHLFMIHHGNCPFRYGSHSCVLVERIMRRKKRKEKCILVYITICFPNPPKCCWWFWTN